jgi:acyl-CoA synthetase (NDP forming)
VPPAALEQTLDEAIVTGCRAVVIITGGEADGGAGDAGDASLAARAREAGAILVGPNCLGVFDAAAQLALVPNELPHGSIGLLSQSGNLALEIGLLAEAAGLGFSRFVSLGNHADLEVAELIHGLAEHDDTELIAIYVEDFRDGRAFARAADAATRAGKRVVLLAVQRSEATARAVRSHTGALASDRAAIDAACRAAGMERVRGPQELVDLAQGLLRARSLLGRWVAVIADGGGHGSVAAALAHHAGLELSALSARILTRLRERLAPPAVSVERMAPLEDGVELLVGARWDARFGPVALVGRGGVYTEAMRDVAVALAPVDEATALDLLLSLRAAPLLRGACGRPARDLEAAAAAVVAVSRVAAAHPEIAEIEFNPLLALPDEALGLDARVVRAERAA